MSGTLGGAFGIALSTTVFSMPNEKVGLATGLYKMSGTLGGAFGIALSTTVFSMPNEKVGLVHFQSFV
ncbi:multidrug resistance protein B [Staphylococcus aureus]|nr:multidrug resistance protein B [Staphylococcus aureus]